MKVKQAGIIEVDFTTESIEVRQWHFDTEGKDLKYSDLTLAVINKLRQAHRQFIKEGK